MLHALALSTTLLGWAPPPPIPAPLDERAPEEMKRSQEPDRTFTFYGFFLSRAEMTNISPQSDLFKGQVFGRLFGANTTSTSRDRAVFLEQRFVPFFVYEPSIVNKKARLRASFEIDFTFGDVAYGVGGNFGGAIAGDQVNIQTQNLAIEVDLPLPSWSVTIGLQRLWDTAYDPYRTVFQVAQQTGERLNFWGTDAVGLTVQGTQWGQRFKLGAYQLYENFIQRDDDVSLFEFVTDRHLGRTWHVGGSARYLRDTSQGQGGVSVLGQGPDSTIADYLGAFRFPIPDDIESWRGHFGWVGANASYNPMFTTGRLGGSAYVVGNFGQISTQAAEGAEYEKLTDILGVALNLRMGVRYGRSAADRIVGELIYTSGDSNALDDGRYSGVITGNTWGAPGALFAGHGAYLLMPHVNVVNRFYAAVPDISNLGFGLTAGTLQGSVDIVRNVLALTIGGAAARANIRPQEGANFIGGEINGNLVWRVRPFMNLEAHAAYLVLGDYFRSSEIVPTTAGGKPRNPWTAFLVFKWLML